MRFGALCVRGNRAISRSSATTTTLLVGQQSVVVRLLTAPDEVALCSFFARNSDPGTVRYFHPFSLDPAVAQRLAHHQGRDRYYVALYSGDVIALSMLRGWDDGYVVPSFGILVDHDWRSRGLGSALLEFTLDEARVIGASCVRLSVYASHVSALQLYLKQGFVEQTRRTVDVGSEIDEIIVLTKGVERVAPAGRDART
jgi:[ribosomal protein S18]-alanine N-acetyltransferase